MVAFFIIFCKLIFSLLFYFYTPRARYKVTKFSRITQIYFQQTVHNTHILRGGVAMPPPRRTRPPPLEGAYRLPSRPSAH